MIELKKGDKVILKGFTGIKLGVFIIDSATKKTVTVLKRNGDEMIFDRKTGKQVNVDEGKERYANSIIEDDGSFVAPSTRGAKKKADTKKAAKKTEPEPEEADEDEEDEDEEEEPKPAKKAAAKKAVKAAPAKKSKKAPKEEPEEDEDEDEFEEDDD